MRIHFKDEFEHFADDSEERKDLETLNKIKLTRWELDEIFLEL